ncbi:MAG: OmpH family outer membrane protein [Burkholderiaceae bacterium]|nr:OmpH family outer membrane protein [Burkholderiaceae bacterium]
MAALLVAACAAGAMPVFAQGPVLIPPVAALSDSIRIAFVNPDRVLREALPAKNAQAKLEAEFSKRESDLKAEGAALKAASDRFERDALTFSDGQRQQRQRELIDQDSKFQRKRADLQEDFNARKNDELQQLLDRTNRAIKQVAEQEGYDAVLQEALYFNPKYDITNKVIKMLNASPAWGGK